jgi:hypothetical protein
MPLIVIGEKPEKTEMAGPRKPARKFMGIGGKYSEEPSTNEDTATEEGSTDVDQARMFLDAVKSGNPRRTLEAFKALLQSCNEAEEE